MIVFLIVFEGCFDMLIYFVNVCQLELVFVNEFYYLNDVFSENFGLTLSNSILSVKHFEVGFERLDQAS